MREKGSERDKMGLRKNCEREKDKENKEKSWKTSRRMYGRQQNVKSQRERKGK